MSRVWVYDLWGTKESPKASYGKGDRWQVRWIDPDTRRPKTKKHAKRIDADAHATFIENSLREGSYVSPEVAAKTVGDALEAWLASKKSPKAASVAKYRRVIDDYLLPRWQTTPLSRVSRTDIDSWVAALQDGSAPRREGMRGTPTGLASSTIEGTLVPFIGALRFAVQQGWIRRNPAEGVETPKSSAEPVTYLTYAELEHLIEMTRTTASAQDALMVAIMGNIGLRIGEVIALTVSSVEIPRRRIHVSATMTTDAKGKPILGTTPKTSSGDRLVPIPPHLIDALTEQTKGRPPSAPLFPSSTGSHLAVSNWRNRVWRAATEAASAPTGLTPKSLRHTAASLAIASGADVLMVQKMLGHADAKETLNTYAKLFPDRMDEVTAKMSKARAKALAKASRTTPSS